MKLPDSWIETTLGDIIVDLQPGFAQRPGEEDDGSIPQIRTHNVNQEGKLTLEGIKFVTPNENELERYSLRKGDILFNNTNSEEWVGKTAVFDQEGTYVFSNHMTRIRVNTDLVEPHYLAAYLHLLWSVGFSKNRAKQWVNQASIEGKALSTFKLMLPTIAEQDRIVRFLKHSDRLVLLRTKIKDLILKTKQQLFVEMFGDPHPIFNEKWPADIIGKNIEVGTGGTPLRANVENFNGDIAWVKSTDLTDSIILNTEENISNKGVKSSNAKIYPKGTILLAMYGQGQTRGRTGKLLLEAACNQACAALVPNESFNQDYLWLWLQLSYNYIRSLGRGGQQENLNLKIIRSLKIPIPPRTLQDSFSKKFQQLLNLEQKILKSNTKTIEGVKQLKAESLIGGLTKNWRQKNEKTIKEAIKARDAVLSKTKQRKFRTTVEIITETTQAELSIEEKKTRRIRKTLLKELSDFQKSVRNALQKLNRMLIPDDSASLDRFCTELSAENENNLHDRVLRALDQLAALGLIAKVSLPNEQGHYLNGFRMLREGESRRVADIQTVNTAMKRLEEQKAAG